MKEGEWLKDLLILKSLYHLSRTDPKLEGFENINKGTIGKFMPTKNKFIQILFVNENHWITVSNVFSKIKREVIVYDSMNESISPTSLKQTNMLVPNVIIRTPTVQHQGPGECGVFAILFHCKKLQIPSFLRL